MGSFYTRGHTAGDHIHTDIRTCNTEAPKQKYPLERSIKDYWWRETIYLLKSQQATVLYESLRKYK